MQKPMDGFSSLLFPPPGMGGDGGMGLDGIGWDWKGLEGRGGA